MWVRVAVALEFSSTPAHGVFLRSTLLIKKLHSQNQRYDTTERDIVTQITTNLHDMYIKPHYISLRNTLRALNRRPR